jgi:hypothetical protein
LHLRDIEIEGYGKRLRLIWLIFPPWTISTELAWLACVGTIGNATQALVSLPGAEGNIAYLETLTAFQWNAKPYLMRMRSLLQLVEKWVGHDLDHERHGSAFGEINAPAAGLIEEQTPKEGVPGEGGS